MKGLKLEGTIKFEESEGGFCPPYIMVFSETSGVIDLIEEIGNFIEKYDNNSSRPYCFDEKPTHKKYRITIEEI